MTSTQDENEHKESVTYEDQNFEFSVGVIIVSFVSFATGIVLMLCAD